jgi:hypothetical protein
MSKNGDGKPVTNPRLQEGYQPQGSEKRGYQVGLDKGYQPYVQTSATVHPPAVGTTAVIPTANPMKVPVASAADKK